MKALDYIFAARPLLHLPVWSVYLVCLYYHQRLNGGRFGWSNLLMLALLSAAASAAYYINQVYDFESDHRNKKLGFLQNGILSERNLMIAYVGVSAAVLMAAALFSLQMLVVFAQLFLLGYAYSAPPFRLKDRPFWGFLTNAYGYGFLVPFTVMPDISLHSAGLLGWDNPFYFFLTVGSIYVLTTLPDKEGDRATGKRTIGVVLPHRAALVVAAILMTAAAWIAFYSGHEHLMYLSVFSSLLILTAVFVTSGRFMLFAVKFPILLLTLLAGCFFFGYFLFIVALLIGCRVYYQRRFDVVYPKLT